MVGVDCDEQQFFLARCAAGENETGGFLICADSVAMGVAQQGISMGQGERPLDLRPRPRFAPVRVEGSVASGPLP